ncbi:MAG: hypothetical protein RSA65_07140, partial [Clostridia bacterium]
LCMRAGKLASGQEACVELVRSGKAAVAFMDEEASLNTKKRVTDACKARETPLYELAADALGDSIGKSGRMVTAIASGGMADKLLQLLKDEPRL